MCSLSNDLVTPESFGETFLNGKPETIYAQCVKEFKEMISLQQFTELVRDFNAGVEHYAINSTSMIGFQTQYVWLDSRQEKAVCVVFDSVHQIHRLLIKPYLTFPKSDQRYTQNLYTMPIQEEWFVFWGGKDEFLNYHYLYESQRYAYDLIMMKNYQSYKDNPMRNENYYAFNQEVVAPANGQIVKVINHLKDNVPGEMDETQPAGNYVVIKHLNNEYSLLAHFKQNSIQPKEGELVQQGQFIGLCGNSGNSSEPHIHFQVMDSPDLNTCKSICIRFADGTEPVQGDTVSLMTPDNDSGRSQSKGLDKFDKAEIAFSFTDVLLIIPRLFAQLFK
ncbi:M23 family metallopeptidase [Planomicrobium chinense]|uniref:M23 family metallopeptidase n=1 Tax=Planococcus chinensis TaxID=272917 RepID=UPI001CC6ED00|nr:M23 family metallopeptidase [Planococcus chinensis]MBZ5201783.1 M23 family metallopeptidase [Planococcus chinensis]